MWFQTVVGYLKRGQVFVYFYFGQMKMRRKIKSNDRDDGLSSPTVPSITYDSLDDGRDGGQDSVSSIQQSGITNNKLRYC